MKDETQTPKGVSVKVLYESVPLWVRIPVFLLAVFVGGVFWFEDRDTNKVMSIITPVEARLDQRVDSVSALHNSDMIGIKDTMTVIVKQNDRIIEQNNKILLNLKNP